MMNAEPSAFSRMRILYARISSTAPKERLYRQLKSSEAIDLMAAMEPREVADAAPPEDTSQTRMEAG